MKTTTTTPAQRVNFYKTSVLPTIAIAILFVGIYLLAIFLEGNFQAY